MPNPPKKSSAYAEYLYHMIDEYFLKRGSAFTVAEIAEFAQLKVTTNMRRRLRHAVVSGKLAVTAAYTERRGKGNLYYLPSDLKAGEFPF